MSTPRSTLADRVALFESEWLQAVVADDYVDLPPPLPNQIGTPQLGEGLPATAEGSGAQMAAAFFEELSQTAAELSAQGRGVAQIGLHLERYLELCRAHLARCFNALDSKERPLVALLPYLLNANLAGLPGYQKAAETPQGIADFDFNATTMRAVEQIFGHRKRPAAPEEPAILSVFCETELGQARRCGDGARRLDLWLLLQPYLLRRDEASLLREKCAALTEWMSGRGFQLHFHLVDSSSLVEERAEGAGPTKEPSLLREHIYRSTFLIAGRAPLWWIAPPAIQSDSYERLQRAIQMSPIEGLELLDLGALAEPPPEELLAEGLNSVQRALQSPFQSLLELMLSLARLEGVPFHLPSERLKQSVFAGRHEIEYTEQRLIESDLLHRFFESTEERYMNRLVRISVALQLSVPMIRKRPGQTPRAVYLMRHVGRGWGWGEALMDELDGFSSWPSEKIDALLSVVRDTVLKLYQRLSLIAERRSLSLDEARDILRRRRISACFEQMEGKVPQLFLTALWAGQRKEEKLTFVESSSASSARRWQLFREQEGRPLFVSETLPMLCAWAVSNGFFTPHTAVTLSSGSGAHNIVELRALLHRLHELLEVTRAAGLPEKNFSKPPQTQRLLIVVSPGSFREEFSNSYATRGWDVLNYGQQRRSQLTDISLISYNSWGEIFCRRYQGPEAFPKALLALYGPDGSRLQLDQELEVLGPNDRAQPMVRKRIEEIFRQASAVVEGQNGVRRVMAYEVGGQYQLFIKNQGKVRIGEARSLRGLIRHMSHLSSEPQELFIDQLSPSLREFRALVSQHQSDEDAKIYVAWRQRERLGHVIVCDERRRLFLQQCSASETRLTLVRTVRRLLPHLRKQVGSVRELQRALRVFQFQDGQLVAGRGPIFSESTSQVLGALSKAKTGGEGLWLVGSLADGRRGLGLQYGDQEFWASRYGGSFIYACVKHILEREGLDNVDSWTLDGSKVSFDGPYRVIGVGAIQQLRLVSIYQREITKALNYILQHQYTTA